MEKGDGARTGLFAEGEIDEGRTATGPRRQIQQGDPRCKASESIDTVRIVRSQDPYFPTRDQSLDRPLAHAQSPRAHVFVLGHDAGHAGPLPRCGITGDHAEHLTPIPREQGVGAEGKRLISERPEGSGNDNADGTMSGGVLDVDGLPAAVPVDRPGSSHNRDVHRPACNRATADDLPCPAHTSPVDVMTEKFPEDGWRAWKVIATDESSPLPPIIRWARVRGATSSPPGWKGNLASPLH